MQATPILDSGHSKSHLVINWLKYIIFLAVIVIIFLSVYFLYLPKTDNPKTSISELLDVFLGITGFTIPLLLSYLMHPHETLYQFLSSHIQDRLGAHGIRANEIDEISSSVASKQNVPLNVKRYLSIQEHRYWQSEGKIFSEEDMQWLLDEKRKNNHSYFRLGRDRQSLSCLVIILSVCMLSCLFALLLRTAYTLPLVEQFAFAIVLITALTNLATYAILLNYINQRSLIKASGLRTINTNFGDALLYMKQVLQGTKKRRAKATELAKDTATKLTST